jgi:hypothetical protein
MAALQMPLPTVEVQGSLEKHPDMPVKQPTMAFASMTHKRMMAVLDNYVVFDLK